MVIKARSGILAPFDGSQTGATAIPIELLESLRFPILISTFCPRTIELYAYLFYTVYIALAMYDLKAHCGTPNLLLSTGQDRRRGHVLPNESLQPHVSQETLGWSVSFSKITERARISYTPISRK